MKKSFFLISAFFILFTFSSCSSSKFENDDDIILILKCENGDIHYSNNADEKKAVLKIFNSSRIPDFIAFIRDFETFVYTDIVYLFNKKEFEILEEYKINIDDKAWGPGAIFFPKNLDKMISLLHKAVKHEDEIVNQNERRQFIEQLKSDENVVFIQKDINLMRQDGYFKIYVPASSKEEMTSRRIGEIQRELGDLYGYEAVFAIDLLPLNFLPEEQVAELTVHGPIAFYEKIEKYRKSEFKEANWYKSVVYYTKE